MRAGADQPRADTPDLPANAEGRTCSTMVSVCVMLVFVQWARGLLIPLTIGVVLSFTLNRLVRRLVAMGVPRAGAAVVVLMVLWGSVCGLVVVLQDDITTIAAATPDAAQRLARGVDALRSQATDLLDGVRAAIAALEHATAGPVRAPDAGQRSPVRVHVEAPLFRLSDFLWTGSLSAVAFAGQVSIVSFLVFFFLCSGAGLKRRVVALAGPRFAQRRAMVRLIDRIGRRIQQSLLIMACTNLLVGVVTGLAFWLLGLPNVLVWMVVTAALHFVPYLGAGLLALAAAAVGWLETGSWALGALAALLSLAIATVIGTLLTTGWQSRVSRLDPAAVFVGLLVWAWLWGLWGFLLGMPLMAMVKVVCDHVPRLARLGRLLEVPVSRWPWLRLRYRR